MAKRTAKTHYAPAGEILKREFLEPLGLSVAAAAVGLDIPRSRLNDIVRGKRAITPDTAIRLGIFFGTGPQIWLDLQSFYDLEVAKAEVRAARKMTAVRRFPGLDVIHPDGADRPCG